MSRIALALAFLLPIGLWADEIELKSGGKVQGIVREENSAEVVIETATGMVKLSRGDIAGINKSVRSPIQDYYDKLKACVKAEDFDRLADWAADAKLTRFVKEARAQAVALRKKEFEDAVKALGADPSADALYDLGAWAKKHGLDADGKGLLERAILKNPDHEFARRDLGFKRYDGKWLTEDEIMLAKGFVKFEGSWVTESQKELLIQERTAKFKEREKKLQEAERKLADREADVSKREAAVKKEKTDAEAEGVKLKQLEKKADERDAWLTRIFGDVSQIQTCPTCKIWWTHALFKECPFCAYKRDHK